MKKLLITLLSVLVVLTIAGCQNKETPADEQAKDAEVQEEVEETNDKLDFNDISFEAYYGVDNSKRYMLMDITNNSEFEITDIEFTYTEKDGVTDEERTAFIEAWSELSEMSVEELHDWNYDKIEFSTRYDDGIKPGETATTHFYYLHGIYYLMDEDQFNLSAPDYAEIEYIASDNKIHTTYYDFRANKQRYSNEVKDVD